MRLSKTQRPPSPQGTPAAVAISTREARARRGEAVALFSHVYNALYRSSHHSTLHKGSNRFVAVGTIGMTTEDVESPPPRLVVIPKSHSPLLGSLAVNSTDF